MPAASEGAPVALPHTWRPLGVRMAGVLFGGLLLVVCAFAWFSFDAETRAKFTIFQRGTLVVLGARRRSTPQPSEAEADVETAASAAAIVV